jgi:hypothetical protein
VFPDDFERQTLVRIYVPYALAMNVPAVGADKHNATVLTIEANGIRSRVGPYAGGAVYLGVKDVQAATALAESKRAEFDLKQHARLDARAERSDLAAYLAEMHQGQKVLPHWNLNRKHTVTARVEIEGAAVLTCSVRVVDTTIADCAMKEIVK